MTKTSELTFLKDAVANKILRAESCRNYVVALISTILNFDIDYVRDNLRLVDMKVSNNVHTKNQEADVVFENSKDIYNIEVNYNFYKDMNLKNTGYVLHLLLRQTKPGKSYSSMNKKVYQINLNAFDFYRHGDFIYHSYVMNKEYYDRRDVDFFNRIT